MRVRVEIQILARLAAGGGMSWSRLLDGQDGSLDEVAAGLRGLATDGLIAITDGRCDLTPAGRREAAGWSGAAGADPGCPACEGTGYGPHPAEALPDRLTALLEDRPGPRLDYDQGAVTPLDLLRRVAFMVERGDVHGRRIVHVGDFDLLSLALATIGLPERIVVLDIDDRVVDHINRAAARVALPVEARRYDVRDPIDPDLIGRFDVFVCDPVETLPGLRLYLSRGAAALKGPESAAYFGLTTLEASRRKWYDLQSVAQEMGFVVTDIRRRFSSYPDHDAAEIDPAYGYGIVDALGPAGAGHRWYRSAFWRLEAVGQPRVPITGRVNLGDDLYRDEEALATPVARPAEPDPGR